MLDAESNALIGLNAFWGDPRFNDVQGNDAASGTRYNVAVLDSGLDLGHPYFGPDLINNRTGASGADGIGDRIVAYQTVYPGEDEDASGQPLLPASCQWDPLDPGGDVFDEEFQDDDGHGTLVASIAAGDSQLSPHSGMAPEAGIIGFRVRTIISETFWDRIATALDWVLQHHEQCNIVAVNMSFGTFGGGGVNRFDPAMPMQFPETFSLLSDLEAEGVLLVGAAGNGHDAEEWGVLYPAIHPGAVAVGATFDADVGPQTWGSTMDFSTDPDRVVSFSQRVPPPGTLPIESTKLPDVYAPGSIITGAKVIDPQNPNDLETSDSGTSFATPHIAGVGVLAQQLAVRYLGDRLRVTDVTDPQTQEVLQLGFRSLLQLSGKQIFDGDDEDDDVSNVQDYFARVDMVELADAIVPPQVASVTIGSSLTGDTWPLPAGTGEQIRTVPVAQANQISLKFTEDMLWTDPSDPAHLDQFSMHIHRLSAAGSEYVFLTDFDYDPVNRTGTWTFDDDPNPNNAVFISGQLEFSLTQFVTDKYGNKLNGSWNNPTTLTDTGTSVFPSGTLPVTVSNFEIWVTLLPGDATRDNVVDIDDLNTVYNNWGLVTTVWTLGEMTGDGVVNLDDRNEVSNHFGFNFTVWSGGGAQAASSGGATTLTAEAQHEAFVAALAQLYATHRKGRSADEMKKDAFWADLATDEKLWQEVMTGVEVSTSA